MKKLKLVILALSILVLSTSCFGYESITICPKELTSNTSTIKIFYEMKYPFPVSNFSLSLESQSIKFSNNSIYVPYIKENSEISGIIVGNITNKSIILHNITIFERYFSNGSLVSSVMHYKLYMTNGSINESEVECTNKLFNNNTTLYCQNNTNLSNNSNEIGNESKNESKNISLTSVNKIAINITNTNNTKTTAANTSKSDNYNYTPVVPSNSKSNLKPNSNSTYDNNLNNASINKNDENSSNGYILYGILGLIMGVLLAVIIVYLYDL